MATFAERFKPTLDRIRSRIPTTTGIRSAQLTVRVLRRSGSMLDGSATIAEDKVIASRAGDRYKMRELSSKEIVAGGDLFENGSIRVGPITPPYAGSAFTKEDLFPPSSAGQEVFYGVTDSAGFTKWCTLASKDTLNDLHWFLVLNPTSAEPESP